MINRYAWRADDSLTRAGFSAVAKLDPYSQWLLGLGQDFDFARDETEEDPADFDFLATIREDGVGGIGRSGEIRLEFAEGFDLSKIDELVSDNKLQLAFRAPLRKRSVAPDVMDNARTPPPTWTKPDGFDDDASERPVVIGIVDDAINPVHRRFRDGESGVRMDFFWRQDGVWPDAPTPPADLQFGREFTRDILEAAVAAHGDDEDRLFSALGLTDFSRFGFNRLARRRAHGTHVLDTAAGADPTENKVRRRLIAVQLPALTTLQTSGATTAFFFLKGLEYILSRARLISNGLENCGGPVPVVLNFSYGFAGGPHNGQYILERLAKQIISKHWSEGGGAVHLVHPSGNRQLRRGHAVARNCTENTKATTLDLPWRILPADRSPNYLEVWAPLGDSKSFHVVVEQPNGDRQEVAVEPDKPQALARVGATDEGWPATAIARATVDDGFIPKDVDGADLRRLLLIVSPTDTNHRSRDAAPAGIWRVKVTVELEPGQSMHAWIQRDEPPSGFRKRGEQSYFDDPDYKRFDETTDVLDVDPEAPATPVRRRGTISGLTTGSRQFQGEQDQIGRLFVAGAYWGRRNDDRATSFYSASGLRAASADDAWPERDPSLSARADTSRTLRGILGAGARSGCRFAMSGTSVAAPQVARAIADALANGRNPVNVEDLVDSDLGKGEESREGEGRLPIHDALEFQIRRGA